VILVDTSILIRLNIPEIADFLRPLLEAGTVATCGLIDLEVLTRVTAPARLAEVTALHSAAFHWLSTTDADLRAAIRDQRELLEAGQPAACWPARLVAAIARRHQVPVLHKDPCFERIGKLTGQDMQWGIPPGGSDGFSRELARQDGCNRAT